MDEEKEKIDSLPSKPTGKRGGPRPNSGRKKGALAPETIEKNRVQAAMRQRIFGQADRLISAQLTNAFGCSYLYVVHTDAEGKRGKAQLVTDPEIIKLHIDGELKDAENEYYFITTEKPDSKAIEDLLNRGFGKPEQAITGNLDVNLNTLIEKLDDRFNPEELAAAEV
jgi:hypothetical protein